MKFVILDGQVTETAAGFDWEPHMGDSVAPIPFPEIAAEVHSLYRCADLL